MVEILGKFKNLQILNMKHKIRKFYYKIFGHNCLDSDLIFVSENKAVRTNNRRKY